MIKLLGRESLIRAVSRFEVLRVRDLRFVFGATLASSLGDGIVSVALAFAVLDLTGSAADLGIVFAARAIAQVAMMLIGGVAADRVSRRSVMITADLARFGSQVAIGVLLASRHATIAELAVSQVLLGIGSSFFVPASSGLIRTVAGEHAQEANALWTIAGAGARLLGPALGGLLVVTTGPAWAMILDGFSYLISAVLLLGIGRTLTSLRRDTDAPSFWVDMLGGFREVRSRTWLWSLIVNMAVGNILFTAWPVLAPLICKRYYSGAPAYAALGVAWTAGMLAGGTLVLWTKPRYLLRVAMLASIPWTVPGILLGLRLPIYVIAAFQFIAAAGISVEGSLFWTAMQQSVPAEATSRVTSWDYAATMSIMPLGYLLVGPLEKAIGATTALVACSAAVIVVTSTCFVVRDVRTLERELPEAAGAGHAGVAGA